MKYLFLILFISMIHLSYSQDTTQVVTKETKQSKPIGEKFYYGGNIGLSFGSYTMIGIYPLVGFKITPKLSTGVKVAYEYIMDKRYATDYTTSNYGASIFARYRIIPALYIHVEYAGLNYELYNAVGDSNREWIPFLFAGAGYSQALGNNVWLNAQILFDVLQSSNSPYNDWEPFYSIGISAGF
ncbi:MAG: hypothetical protein QM503_13790 [Bacteroidota bacterium]